MTSRRPGRRQHQALETRRAILDAARRLFTERGYGATSVAEVAEAAGVALPTVYTSVGPKPQLLRLLVERIDEEAEIPALAATLSAANDPRQVLALQVHIARQVNERCGDILAALQSAAGVESDMTEAFAAGMKRHRAGCAATVEHLGRLGGLRGGVPAEEATAAVATLTMPSVFASLTGEFGWTFDRAESWIVGVLAGELLEARTGATR